MEKTTHYQLNKPEVTDPMRVADFNENADILDAALNSMNTAVGSLAASMSNCRMAYGSYDGAGTYGEGNPVTLSFDFKPLLVVVSDDKYRSSLSNPMVLCHGQSMGLSVCGVQDDVTSSIIRISWGENSVSWYNATNDLLQNNNASHTYHYVVLGVTE